MSSEMKEIMHTQYGPPDELKLKKGKKSEALPICTPLKQSIISRKKGLLMALV
jgi:hypothetical protein